MDEIKIKGARQHNLKNISLSIPKNKLVVITGVSGSGKSSLAFDTIYAEGQRRYVESLSAYARQFLGVADKPDVDSIEGLSPAIAIDQKSVSHNPRSTVGTITEIYDYLRLLFARIGHPHCPHCNREIARKSVVEIAEEALSLGRNVKSKHGLRLLIMAPVVRERKGEYSTLLQNLKKQGYSQVRLDGILRSLDEDIALIRTNKHSIDVVIDRIVVTHKSINEKEVISRISQDIEQSLKIAEGNVIVSEILDNSFSMPDFPKVLRDHLFSERFACPNCNIALLEIEPRSFSFNSPQGACPTCSGIGSQLKVDKSLVINPILTINEGGILPWGRLMLRDSWFRRSLEAVSEKLKFSLDVPMGDLSQKVIDVLLYGSEEFFSVSGLNRYGRRVQFENKFEGVVSNLERRYLETQSDQARTEIEKYMTHESCPGCNGSRLKRESLSITVMGKSIADVSRLSVSRSLSFIREVSNVVQESPYEREVAKPILKEIISRLTFLMDVGLDYLTISRTSGSLAGGEAQRIRLASQIGSGLSGVVYVLDEPSIGLHSRDQSRLIATLKKLRDLGNSVLVIEHDKKTMIESDYIIDIGPGAGERGGYLVSLGTPSEVMADNKSLTGQYLSGRRKLKFGIIPKIGIIQIMSEQSILLRGCKEHNLKNINVTFPLGKLIGVVGVSGSGKSTLVNETLYRALKVHFGLKETEKVGTHSYLEGAPFIDKIINIDQSPIGRSPRSNPVTYIKTFDNIRRLFASLPEARLRGFDQGRFSFNVKGGRCEVCQGDGQIRVEMQFLPDVYVTCESCNGKRYNRETLEIEFNGKNIFDVLNMTVDEALKFFNSFEKINRGLRTLSSVGLGYIRLGQSATTLSGGEAQRVKLSLELSKRSTGKTLYLLDEPTTGLHFADIEKLLSILRSLVNRGNTVVVIEHNLDVVGSCDYVIELGPEGGDKGGEAIFEGRIADLLGKNTPTAQSLKEYRE